MTDPMPARAVRPRMALPWPAPAALALTLVLTLVLVLAGCALLPSASPSASPPPPASPTPTASPSPEASPTETAEPTATPEPPLSLDVPAQDDPRRVRVTFSPDVPANGDGRIVVTVVSLSDERIAELVLRWPTELRDTLFLAPFEPSQQRIAEFGPPLWQEWTKWVDGPGERGEPAGTTSLGWGPLLPGATLTIPLLANRNAAGPTEFDLQVLAEEAILTLEDGGPGELRVQVP